MNKLLNYDSFDVVFLARVSRVLAQALHLSAVAHQALVQVVSVQAQVVSVQAQVVFLARVSRVLAQVLLPNEKVC
jgi:hypothetical protein